MFDQELSKKDKEGFGKTYNISTTTVLLNGNKVNIHGVCIGRAAIKSNFKKKVGYGNLERLNLLLESYYNTFLPIWIWVIEHPEGLIVIDSGEIKSISDLDKYLNRESWSMKYKDKTAAKFLITEKKELEKQFKNILLTVEDIKSVILMNLKLENEDLSKLNVYNKAIIQDDESRVGDKKMRFCFPEWSVLKKISNESSLDFVSDKIVPITQANGLFYVPNPRQKQGTPFVKFRTDEFDIIFSGDDFEGMFSMTFLKEIYAEIDIGNEKQKIVGDFSIPPTIHISIHDENAGEKLMAKTFVK
jgi:hypothetical protein